MDGNLMKEMQTNKIKLQTFSVKNFGLVFTNPDIGKKASFEEVNVLMKL